MFLTDKDDAFDHVKVLDFGISRFLMLDDKQKGMVMGTPEFMAPEQITDPENVDRRADIYALGVILYEMLTARRPFASEDDPRQLLHRIVHEAPPPLMRPEVPHGLAEMILGEDAREGSRRSLPDDERCRGRARVVHHAQRRHAGAVAPQPADSVSIDGRAAISTISRATRRRSHAPRRSRTRRIPVVPPPTRCRRWR